MGTAITPCATYEITASNCAGSMAKTVDICVRPIGPTVCFVMGNGHVTVGSTGSLEILVDEDSDPITHNAMTLTGSGMRTNTTLCQQYTFTVSNAGGSVQCNKQICTP